MSFVATLLTLSTLMQVPSAGSARPPSVAPASDREIGFAGFNLHPLKASVLPVDGSWFAVLVAGSGPTDRNWSNPMLPKGQTGRDFALWLQKQGVGSLRFDKRFIGAKDPKLDISLDAQVGDIRAAMKAARSLPEAKGKKLLLVGHSEGALLGMMAAADADALLLIGLPAQSMGRTILAQLKLQLPPETADRNLAYMAQVFEAIRQRKETPEGTPEIYPNLVMLARNIMRPESLDFVRATLDLDPWALAARLSAPCAVAWGEKDVQTWKPERIPAAFKGRILELPGANHVLRQEPRPRAELNGANAASNYGESAPMADLAPLAAWLKELK